ncbi:MATE family efflux transporter [bacterium]|nr:MATE family efflux transporter [bacterium]
MSRAANLITGPVGSRLLRMSGPMLMGLVAIMAFNLVDTFFLGRYGADELAAVSFTFPVVMTLGSVALGLGMGVTAVVSNAIGEGDAHRVARLTTDSLVLAVLVVVVFAGVGLLTVRPLFAAMGAEGHILDLVVRYMRIWYLSVGLVVIPMVGNSAIRATGDTRTPGLVMVVAGLTNAVGDPLLIFGLGPFPELGIEGAAIATAVSRAITLVAALYVLGIRDRMISRERPTTAEGLANWRRVLHVGVPAAGTRMVMPVGVGVVTRMVAGFGPAAVAAFGVGSRVGMLVFAVIMALGAALVPFVGQNLGARRPDRVRRAAWFSVRFGVGYGLVLWVLMFVAARPLAGLFSDHADVVDAAALYFRIVPLGMVFAAILALTGTVLNGMLMPLRAALLSALQMFGLYVPLALLGARWFALPGIYWASVAAYVVAGMLSLVVMRRALAGIGDPAPTAGPPA